MAGPARQLLGEAGPPAVPGDAGVPAPGPPDAKGDDVRCCCEISSGDLTRARFGRAPDQCDDRQLYEALLTLCPGPGPGAARPGGRAEAVLLFRRVSPGQVAVQPAAGPGPAGRGEGLSGRQPGPERRGVPGARALPGQRGAGPAGRLLPGLHRRPGPARGRGGAELPLRPVPAGCLRGQKQTEEPDPWIEPSPAGSSPPDRRVLRPLRGGGADRRACTTSPSPAARNGVASRLHLFDVERPAHAPWSGHPVRQGGHPPSA